MVFHKMWLIVLISLAIFSLTWANAPGSDIQAPSGVKLLKTGVYGSKLYQFNTEKTVYDAAPYLVDLTASTSYQQGYDNAYLLCNEYVENYNNLMVALLGDKWWEPAVANLIGELLDWQWKDYLGVQLPDEYKQEIQGMTDGSKAGGCSADVGLYAGRGVTLANLPGTLTNFKYILKDELTHPAFMSKTSLQPEQVMELLEKMTNNWTGLTCSMFGVWGSRTEGGRLYTGRNLDWLKDTGISKYKLITVHHPPGGYSHATFGWAGIWGSITGISSQGITAHEANLESNDITFRGFPWVLRLRHVMAHAKNLAEATSIWSATNSTVGFNHGFGSASDGQAIVLETMMGNSAVFGSNDPREQYQLHNGENIGIPRTEAVYRTNHGYDDYTISHYLWNDTGAFENSIIRYKLFPEMFDNYQALGKKITYVEAVNVTATVGEKGEDHLYDCLPPHSDGSNILSATYDPAALIAYVAWENGNGDENWTPAACNTYVQFNMKDWF